MDLTSYILNDIKPINSNSKISDLMLLFSQLTFSHIPIINKEQVFLGSFSETDAHCFESDLPYEILTGKINKAQTVEQNEKANLEQEKAEELIREKEEKARNIELANLKKEEAKRIRDEEREIARLKKEQIAADKKKERERERLWRNVSDGITKGATTSRGGGLIGKITRGLLGVLGIK